MSESKHIEQAKHHLTMCSEASRATLIEEMRVKHPYEEQMKAPADVIMEAIHRAPELTRRMLRGVIADAAFAKYVVPAVSQQGLKDVTPVGNFAYDYKLADDFGKVTVQVKLQRSEKTDAVVKDGDRYHFPSEVFMTETQKTRSGKGADDEPTRPYRYNEFDILAVSMQPSSKDWGDFKYTVGSWLISNPALPAGNDSGQMAVMQPVSKEDSEFWTSDIHKAIAWFRTEKSARRMVDKKPPKTMAQKAAAALAKAEAEAAKAKRKADKLSKQEQLL